VSEVTGERLPGAGGDFGVDLERHLAAYRHAATRAAGLRVLDAGCGEGYGTALLAEVAAEVVGVDRAEATTVAARRHARPNLAFREIDLAALDALGARFDLVVSFQVIEHLPDPTGFLAALARRTAAGGTIVVTTPNRLMSLTENPYHLREWTAPELEALARTVLPGARVTGVHASARVLAYEQARAAQVARILRLDPLGLRRFLPDALVKAAFGRLARVVRGRVRAGQALPEVGAEDFHVGDGDLARALDLMLVATI
jgi:hypothetical protein